MSAPRKRAAYEPGAALLTAPRRDPDMKRPITTVAGASLVLLRVAIGLLSIVIAAINGDLGEFDTDGISLETGRWIAAAVIGGLLVVQTALALFIFTGHNVARVVVMLIATIDISDAFAGWLARGGVLRAETTPYTVALDVLVLLALSSRSAAAYARRNERS